ncbi:MAG: TAXI family TRAP transporter solute-binding subunit [Cyclobacteriaceae bacterium]
MILRFGSGFVVCIILLFLFVSCNPTTLEYSIIYSTDEPIGEITKRLETVLERNFNVDIKLTIGEGSVANIDSVASGKFDFTITENHVPYREGVSSVIAFYPQILHVFHSESYHPKNFLELVEHHKVFIGAEGSGSYRFMMDLFELFEVDPSNVQIEDNPFGEVDVYAGFTDVLEPDALLGLSGFKLFSFDNVEQLGRGSIVDAITLKHPRVRPYVIPQGSYGSITDTPVVTVCSDAVLVCRSDMRDTPIYDMIKTIFEEKQAFNDISPLIFKSLSENFNRSKLNFPLHEGARIYLDRDEPGFFERYAELFGVTFSLIIALASGIVSLSRWQKQKKKDRVDVFYKVLMDIKQELPNIQSSHLTLLKIKEIKDSQNKAFQMLINEELIADESFRILTELSSETIVEVKQRFRFLKKKEAQKTH